MVDESALDGCGRKARRDRGNSHHERKANRPMAYQHGRHDRADGECERRQSAGSCSAAK